MAFPPLRHRLAQWHSNSPQSTQPQPPAATTNISMTQRAGDRTGWRPRASSSRCCAGSKQVGRISQCCVPGNFWQMWRASGERPRRLDRSTNTIAASGPRCSSCRCPAQGTASPLATMGYLYLAPVHGLQFWPANVPRHWPLLVARTPPAPLSSRPAHDLAGQIGDGVAAAQHPGFPRLGRPSAASGRSAPRSPSSSKAPKGLLVASACSLPLASLWPPHIPLIAFTLETVSSLLLWISAIPLDMFTFETVLS